MNETEVKTEEVVEKVEDTTTEANEEVKSEDTQTFTKEELAAYVKAQIEEENKKKAEEAKKAEEDAKLSEEEKAKRDFKEAQMKLKVDRFNFDISQYRSSLNLSEDAQLDALLKTDSFINSENGTEEAKAFINSYKQAIDAAYNKGKTEAESNFNNIKMKGQEVFNGVQGKQRVETANDFDSIYANLKR